MYNTENYLLQTFLPMPYTHTLNSTFCCNLSFSMGSTDEKFISLDTARHFNIFFGTLASCSLSGNDLIKRYYKY